MSEDKTKKFMDGSSSQKSYLKVGQDGKFGLGVKLYPVNSVNPAGRDLKENSYFMVRIRAALAEGMDGHDDEQVINLLKTGAKGLSNAFSEMPWEKTDAKRKSSFYGMYFPVSVLEDPEGFLDALTSGKMRAFCAGILELLPEEQRTTDGSTIMAYLLGPLAKQLDPMIKAKKKGQEMDEKIKPFEGGFHFAELKSHMTEAMSQPKDEADDSPVLSAMNAAEDLLDDSGEEVEEVANVIQLVSSEEPPTVNEDDLL
jgi:hypothetical protein